MADDTYTLRVDAQDDASEELDDVEESVEDTDDAMEKGSESADMYSAALAGGIAGGIADQAIDKAAELTGALVEQTGQFVESTAEIERNAQAANTTADRYQELRFAFKQMGLDSQALSESLNTISERAVDARNGATGMQEDFRALGITVDELRGKSPAQLFELVTERIGAAKNETQAAKGATALLGDEMANALLPRLRSNADAFEDFSQRARETNNVLGEETREQAKETEKQFNKLSGAVSGMGKAMMADWLPALERVTEELNLQARIIDEAGLLEAITELATPQATTESKFLAQQKREVEAGGMRRRLHAMSRDEMERLFGEAAAERVFGSKSERTGVTGGQTDMSGVPEFMRGDTKGLSAVLGGRQTDRERKRTEQIRERAKEQAKARREAQRELEILRASTDIEEARVKLEQAREKVKRENLEGAQKDLVLTKARKELEEARTEQQEENQKKLDRLRQDAADFVDFMQDGADLASQAWEDVKSATTDEGDGERERPVSQIAGRGLRAAGRGAGRAGRGAANLLQQQERQLRLNRQLRNARSETQRQRIRQEMEASRAVGIHNRAVSEQVRLYSSLGSTVGQLAPKIQTLAENEFKLGEATEATASAASALSQVGGVAAQFVQGTKERAGIKAAFETASSAATLAGFLASGGTAGNLLAASIQHGTAAAMYGAVASGAVSGSPGQAGGGASGGGGGAGGGARSPRQPRINADRQREKTAEAFASKLESGARAQKVVNYIDQRGTISPGGSEHKEAIAEAEDEGTGVARGIRGVIDDGVGGSG